VRIGAQRDFANAAYLLFGVSEDGKRALAAGEVLRDPGAYCEPFAVLMQTEAQQMIDELWACGLRPTEGSGSAGQSGAQQAHIDDLRKITFKLLEK
jgi:hypothetical protein